MNFFKTTIAVFTLLFSSVLFSQATISGELQKWHTVTLTFNGPNTSETNGTNPFLDYRLNITFSSPTGKTFVVPGFYAADGNAAETSAASGNKWRARFTPNETGQWTYQASFRTGSNIAVSLNANAGNATSFNGNSGNFNISASTKVLPDNRAKGRLSYVGERYLQFEETGKYFLKAGSDSPENLLAYNDFDNTVAKKTWSPHAQDWNSNDPTWKGNNGKELIGAINYLSEKGMNAFSFLTMNVIGDGKDVWPWAAANNNDLNGNSGNDANNRLRYDVSKLAQWEILFSHADAKGMYLHFKTQETENDQLLDGGNLGTQRKLYYRELIARFGHHLALNWNLGEEHDLYQELNDSQNTRVKAYASFIKSVDPYDHHIVIHSYPGTNTQNALYNPLLGNASELTGPSVQTDINSVHKDVKRWILASKNVGKQWVVANDEQGGANAGVTTDASYSGSKGSQGDNRKNTRHRVLWGTLMAGGAGVEYYFGYQTGETDLTAQDFRSRNTKWNDAKVALDFFNTNLSFWEMETHDELTSSNADFCLANVNDTYAIYLPNGGSTNLNLSNANGTFTVKWYNPINGGNLVNGSVAQINGGGNRSIGNPPNNRSSDWVALVQKGEATNPQNGEEECSMYLEATSDFDNINVSGFSQAYVDNVRNALAIDAAQFKDKFAAAQTTFGGETGIYDITLNTLTEIDGESSYSVSINGTVIGTYQNPESNTDYSSAGTTFKNVAIAAGAQIRVAFSSDTNGKIPEGNSTAYSRGRWTSLTIDCQSDDPTPPTGNCDADYEEQNGLVVIEAENLGTASGWANSTAVNGFTGNGYIDWQGANSFGNPGNGILTTQIKINTPGTYLFQWRSKVGEGTNTTESNDSWLRFPDADDFFGQKGNSIVYPRGSGKTPTPEGSSADGWFKVYLGGTTNWTWASNTSDNDAHKIYVKFNSAGVYTMEVSGRSKHHLIDRIVLSKDFNNPTNLSLTETLCTGETTTIPVNAISINPETAALEEGNSINLTPQVLPTNASNENVTWSSSNTSVASVNQNGRVTALQQGTATITATSEDGGFTATSLITVTENTGNDIGLTSIRVTPQRVFLEGGETQQLTYTFQPSNATNTNVVWRSLDETIARVDQNGLVTALKTGTVEVEARAVDGGFVSDATVKVSSDFSGTPVTRLYVTPQRVTLEEGQSTVISYQIWPSNATNKNVTWYSEDETIATVDENGAVTALSEGVVEIVALSVDGNFKSDSRLTVIPSTENVAVTGVAMNPQSATIEEGNSLSLGFQISPANASNKNVSWSSLDESIATVNQNGQVTAISEGSVVITVETADGSYTSSSAILVNAKPNGPVVGVRGVYVTSQRVTLEVNETITITYNLWPSNATNKTIVWSSSNESIATVDDNGVVTALRVGTAEIEAKTADGGFVSDATLRVVPSTNAAVQSIIVYPNPTADEIRINGVQAEGGFVGLYSLNGTLLQQKAITNNEDIVLSLAEYHSGTYMVRVVNLDGTITKTVMKL